MKRIVCCCTTVFLAFGVAALGQVPANAPEANKLTVFAGNWKYEGTGMITPTPRTRISGAEIGNMAAGGAGLQKTGGETGVFGTVEWVETEVYDATAKRFRYLGSQSDGTTWQGSGFVAGRVWKYEGTMTIQGNRYHIRSEKSLAPDEKSYAWKTQIRVDEIIRVRGMGGLFRTWKPWREVQVTKIL